MAWDPTPWLVGGGAEHSPEVARLLSYATTSGAEGIVEPSDLRVRALNVPGAGFRVGLGAALIRNRYAGGQQQTYAARNTSEHNFTDVTPTGSGGGRTDLVIARVIDPQYEGDVPADPTDHQYVFTDVIQGVPSSTRTARELNLGYPAIELAKITWPSSTATITNAMITDLRRIAAPRVERRLFSWNVPRGMDDFVLVSSDDANGQGFPNFLREFDDYPWYVDVPEWATHANLMGYWMGVRVMAVPGRHGRIWVRLGHNEGDDGYVGNVDSHRTQWNVDDVGGYGDVQREFWQAGDDRPVPEALRGTRQPVHLRGLRRALGEQNPINSGPRLNDWSSVSVDIQFTEGPA